MLDSQTWIGGLSMTDDILAVARTQVLERGVGLTEAQTLDVLRLSDERVSDALGLAHEVRMRWCGPEIEVEGIVSVKTGGCPEDCHFCSQSGRFETPVRAARLDIPSLVAAARETAATGATEFCIVAAVRGPDARLMEQVRDGVKAITECGGDQRRLFAGDPHARAGRGAARSGGASLQPQSRDGAVALRRGGHDAHLGGAVADA